MAAPEALHQPVAEGFSLQGGLGLHSWPKQHVQAGFNGKSSRHLKIKISLKISRKKVPADRSRYRCPQKKANREVVLAFQAHIHCSTLSSKDRSVRFGSTVFARPVGLAVSGIRRLVCIYRGEARPRPPTPGAGEHRQPAKRAREAATGSLRCSSAKPGSLGVV